VDFLKETKKKNVKYRPRAASSGHLKFKKKKEKG